ncbi:MAG: DUF933 domain-containing protein, partial [Candidatus Omnitrophica bacterium]|nr:DUF933 domain-containing protein [Candidatus Omnitrophota bacterium]
MKIFNLGLKIEPGKYKYKCDNFDKLVLKFAPQKITPYSVEFIETDLEKCDAIVFDIEKKLDLIVIDLDKIEKRILKTEDEKEKQILNKALGKLEEESLLCDLDFTEEESMILKTLQLVTYKPSIEKSNVEDINCLIKEVLKKAEIILFFTAGKKEVHAWSLEKGSSILEAAGKIHSDLKRGFIRADVVNCSELDNF